MHRIEHTGPGEERAEDREAERGHQQRQVPHSEHAPTLLDHDRVHERGAGEPRQERRVLNRVPGPEAAPPEHLVGPPCTEDDADGEEAPREQRPPASLDQPALADTAGDQRGHRKREGDREPDIAEVEHRRVEGDERMVLEERVGPGTVGGQHPVKGAERVGRPEHQAEEEHRNKKADCGGPCDEGVSGPVSKMADDGGEVAGQDQRPQQDRPGQRRPHAGDAEQQRRRPAVVLSDELQREVVGDERVLHGECRDHRPSQHEEHVGPTVAGQWRSPGDEAGDDRARPHERGEEAEDDGPLADRRVHLPW